VFVRSSNFKLPRDPKVPIIMVGPGTGVAPFRGFVQERVWQKEKGDPIGATMLFYGCRRRDEDFLYHDEFQEMFNKLRNNDNDDERQLVLAFSREVNQPKVYVQHRLKERKEQIWTLLQTNRGYFYVCGDAKNMARAVNQTLIDICVECGGYEVEKATKWVKDLRSAGRYQEDVWS